jgi:hypothetical protein
MKIKYLTKGIIKSVMTFFIVFAFFSANGQTPASFITGPLKAQANGSTITLTVQVTEVNPTISYSFDVNTSGASIVSKGAYVYDSSTGVGKQTIEVNPGSSTGNFTVKASVDSPNGHADSSMSVTVIK